VLDTKQGYWQERKRLWINLGIEGELGRELQPGKENHRKDYGGNSATGGYKAVFQCNTGRNVKGKNCTSGENTAMLEGKGQAVSLFDPVLCEVAYTWFCPPNGSILDPFAGGSVRGIIAHMLSRHYTGIDLSQRQINANREQAARIVPGNEPTWIVGDSMELKQTLNLPSDWFYNGEQFDFIFTCPPYYNLEQYSDDPSDLSAKLSYSIFRTVYRAIIEKTSRVLKQNRFACFVVGNLRDSDGNYHDLVGDTVQAFADAGMKLYNEIILLTSIGSLPIRVGSQFNAGRKVGKAHQNVLVFVRGDGMIAAKECEQL